MIRVVAVALVVLGCPGPSQRPLGPDPVSPAPDAAVAMPDAAPPAPVVWLKGSTHVHALPSGDSTTPIPDVIAWYEKHGYDFIALTDHNRVSEIEAETSTADHVAVRAPAAGLIVLAGIELTYNPDHCLDPPDLAGKCRIHLNVLGPTRRPDGKQEWADRRSPYRLDMWARALGWSRQLRGISQLNHPQWHWGMTPELMTELTRRGANLVEIANRQFDEWNAGDATHPSMEVLWDAVLTAGLDIWGVATDDAHHYQDDGGGKYPAGGGWVMVHAAREPEAIKAALAAGRFYSSTGVVLSHAEADTGALVVEVDPASPGEHTIAFISGGAVIQAVTARSARAPIPTDGYVRAVVRRLGDGATAWVQPARR